MELMSQTDTYLQKLPLDYKKELQRIRKIIHTHIPSAREAFSYGMPAFIYKEKPLIYYAAFKDHLSVFPTAFPIEALQDQLKSYKVSKGTIQFTVENPLPNALIHSLLNIRIDEIERGNKR